jgi:hypothetical protein
MTASAPLSAPAADAVENPGIHAPTGKRLAWLLLSTSRVVAVPERPRAAVRDFSRRISIALWVPVWGVCIASESLHA